MSINQTRFPPVIFTALIATAGATLSLVAQSPAGNPTAQTGQAPTVPDPGRGGAPGARGGAGVGRGPSTTEPDFSRKPLEASLPRVLVVNPAWKLSASHNTALASNALTIQPWTSGEPQKAGMWFQVELPQAVSLTQLLFESAAVAPENLPTVPGAPTRTAIPGGGGRGRGGPGAAGAPGAPGAAAGGAAPPPAAAPAPAPAPPLGYPRGYRLKISQDGTKWTPVAQGQGSGVTTDVSFAPVRAKFVRLTQTASVEGAPLWSIQRLRLYDASAGPLGR